MAWANKPSDHVRRIVHRIHWCAAILGPSFAGGLRMQSCRAAEQSHCRHHGTAGEEHPVVSTEAKCSTFSSNAIFQMVQKFNMGLILCAQRMVSSGRFQNTLWILHCISHREQRHNCMGTMIEFFKHLEPDAWETGDTFVVPGPLSDTSKLLVRLPSENWYSGLVRHLQRHRSKRHLPQGWDLKLLHFITLLQQAMSLAMWKKARKARTQTKGFCTLW